MDSNRWPGKQTWTLMLVNLASIMEKADEALLPGVYREIGLAIHASPTGLGSLTLLRSLTQAACFPVAAYLAVHHNRAHVIALGAFLWSAATFLVGVSSTYLQVAVSRALNGVGLAIVVPAIQSLVADSTDEGNRGWAFGWLQLTAFCRREELTIAAVEAKIWRRGNREAKGTSPLWSDLKTLILEARKVMHIRTFQIIVAQGVVGTYPWSALSFVPMWLELIGFSHKQTAFLMGLFIVGSSLGGLFGGRMGDILAAHLPNAGRIILSQISSSSAIPLAAVLLLVLPDDPSSGVVHGIMFFIVGFCISWNAPATNNPIFAEIVPQKSRTSIYALDRSFESVLASFAPAVVGILAQHVYGYKPVPEGSSKATEIETDRENAASLGEALYISIAVPATLCCLIYTFLYWTYPKDRDRARLESQIELELQTIGLDTPESMDYSRVQIYEQDDDDHKKLLDPVGRGESEQMLLNDN